MRRFGMSARRLRHAPCSRTLSLRPRASSQGSNDNSENKDANSWSLDASDLQEAASTAADRLRQFTFADDEDRRSSYAPTSRLAVARSRFLDTYLPYEWAARVRGGLEVLDGQQFSYVVSVGAVIATALISGFIAYQAWPTAHGAVMWLFNAAEPEARNLQVCRHANSRKPVWHPLTPLFLWQRI
jgi:hypothetical protein